jgi:hypothetical protein
MNPIITLLKTLPPAIAGAPLPAYPADLAYESKYVVCWTLKATFPAPHGTVYLRYARPDSGEDCLDVLTPDGKRLQRLWDAPLMDKPPVRLSARWLAPGEKKSPLVGFEQKFPDDDAPKPVRIAFPDGFAGLCSLSRLYEPKKKHVWDGLQFVEGKPGALSADRFAAPERLPASRLGKMTGFGALLLRGRRYLLRWTGQNEKNVALEILSASGRTLIKHRLKDDFGATRSTSLSALWLDEKRQRGPILQTRDSDQVRLHVFSDDLQKLICVQDFDDGSSSLAATTVSFERDKRGVLEVWENYSNSDGDSSRTGYRWSGSGFGEIGK